MIINNRIAEQIVPEVLQSSIIILDCSNRLSICRCPWNFLFSFDEIKLPPFLLFI